MATTDQLISWRDELKAARFTGARIVQYGDKRVEYRDDDEMRAALADIEREIAAAGGKSPVTQIRFSTSKGF